MKLPLEHLSQGRSLPGGLSLCLQGFLSVPGFAGLLGAAHPGQQCWSGLIQVMERSREQTFTHTGAHTQLELMSFILGKSQRRAMEERFKDFSRDLSGGSGNVVS